MDFALTEEQQAVRDLAARILGEQVSPEQLKAIETQDEPAFDEDLWAALAEAGLLGVCVPEEHGGLGLGFVETCLLLEEVGRAVAAVPALATLAYGALPLARFGTAAQQSELLPGVVRGQRVLTGALVEPLGDRAAPRTSARRDGQGFTLTGTKTCVPAGMFAHHILVSATTDQDEVGLFLVDPAAEGVVRRRQDTVAFQTEAWLELDDVRVGEDAVVGPLDAQGTALGWLLEHSTVASCAVMTGVVDAALRLTADYTKTREQFDRPIASFQAVAHRVADAFIDTQAVRLTTLQAMWLLSAGSPAAKEVAVAKFFAAEAGQRVVRATQHLHGGIGVDRDYPVHRYYVWAKQLELALGGASHHLRALGRLLADEPVSST